MDQCKQELRQGGSLSLVLFIIAVDVLARLFKQADVLGLIEGIGNKQEFRGVKSLRFANDILLFCARKEESILAAKAIFLAFEEASGLKINLHKSSILCMKMEDSEASLFVARLDELHEKILSIPVLGPAFM